MSIDDIIRLALLVGCIINSCLLVSLERKSEKPKPVKSKRIAGQICVCTTKVDPGDGVLAGSVVCDLHKEKLECIPGFNFAARNRAAEMAMNFLSFVCELWDNGNRIKEANLYVIFTEDQKC